MRALLLILIVAVIAIIIAISSGFLNINQTRNAQVPEVATTGNGVSARGGQTPAFEVQTGSVRVGSAEKNVKVPTVDVQRPADNQAAVANNAQ
jgi:hypothetical protein